MTRATCSVCVFCASSEAVSPAERAVAAELGRGLAARGWRLVYGGGGVGLMGETARAALAAGGDVLGIIPERLLTREVAMPDLPELVVVPTMRERKQRMDEASDAFIVLPGGIGTLEELVEIVTLKQLGYHDRPIVLLDREGYWEPLLEQLNAMVHHGFSSEGLLTLFEAVRTVEEALDRVAAEPRVAGSPDRDEELEVVEDV
jgi:uncharacterized protein (TIGR00730 family)